MDSRLGGLAGCRFAISDACKCNTVHAIPHSSPGGLPPPPPLRRRRRHCKQPCAACLLVQALALLLTFLAVSCMAACLCWVGSGGSGSGGAAWGRPWPAVERWEPCERAQLNETILQEWGCRVFHKTCFDQVRLLFKQLMSSRHLPSLPTFPATALPRTAPQAHMLLHSGEKTPGHPNYTRGPLFPVFSGIDYVLPTGEPEAAACWHLMPTTTPPRRRAVTLTHTHPPVPAPPSRPADPGESSGQAHHHPGHFVMDIRAPTKSDPPDVWEPKGAVPAAMELVMVAGMPKGREITHMCCCAWASDLQAPMHPHWLGCRVFFVHRAAGVLAALLLHLRRPLPGRDGGHWRSV